MCLYKLFESSSHFDATCLTVKFTLLAGSLPGILGDNLKQEPYLSLIDWSKWHIWFVDERVVPSNDKDSNLLEANKSLLGFVPIPKENIHSPNTALSPESCAIDYERRLRDFFPSSSASLDLILLGMGPDGHTASLFPLHPLLHEKSKWVASIVDSPKPPPQRITLTLPLLNAGRQVAFIVRHSIYFSHLHASFSFYLLQAAGDGKKALIKEVLEGSPPPGTVPSKLVAPTSRQLHWFVDEPAAALLTSTGSAVKSKV